MKKGKTLLLALIAILILGAIGITAAFRSANQTKPVAADSPLTAEAKSVIKRMYLIQNAIRCIPGTEVSAMAEVMVDSTDYQPTEYDRANIERVYGKERLTHAGLLTSRQAYILSLNIEPPPPPPGVQPTEKARFRCLTDPENQYDQSLHILSIKQGKDDRLIVTYEFGGIDEAILRKLNGKWMITSIKMIRPHQG